MSGVKECGTGQRTMDTGLCRCRTMCIVGEVEAPRIDIGHGTMAIAGETVARWSVGEPVAMVVVLGQITLQMVKLVGAL